MAEATDQQMQTYFDVRVRPRAEQWRAAIAGIRDDKLAIDDCFARAVGVNPWADNRTDGPPSLADQSDLLIYNTVITALDKVILGTADVADIAAISSNWNTFQAMCVQPV